MSFILAGTVTAITVMIAYGFLLAGGEYAKSDAGQALFVGLLFAAGLAASHWLGW